MDSTPTRTLLLALLLAFAWCPLPATAAPKDLVLVLDNSGSMKKNDPEFLIGVAVRRFFHQLGVDSRVAILVFDREARLVMPLTPLDEDSRANFLRSLDHVNYQGLYTDSPAAIERAIYELKMNGRPEVDRSIVFITDGLVDTGNEAMDAEKSAWLRNDLAAEAAEQGVRIFGIAFTDSADFLLIQSLSKRTSGEYFRAYSAADIQGVFQRINEELARTPTPAAAASASVPARPQKDTAFAALPEPAPLPQLELPAAASFSSDSRTDPGSLEAEASDATAAPSVLEDMSATETVALPVLPEEEIGLETSVVSQSEQQLAHAGEPTGTLTPEPTPDARPPGETDQLETIPPAATENAEQAELSFLSAWLAPLVATGVVGVALFAGMALRLRRRSDGKTIPENPLPKAFLNDLGGITDKPSYELDESLTVVGRIRGNDADRINYVVIPQPTVGRRHALIEFRNHCFWVADQNSLNGTFINDKRIDDDTRLKHGDRIRFHKHEFEFLLLDMFETDGTKLGGAVFADVSRVADGDNRIQPLTAEDSSKAVLTPGGN